MNQIERVHKHSSNLITGIAVVGAPIQTAASGRSWRTIPLKTRCLGGSPRNQRFAGTGGVQRPVCNLFPSLTIRGKQFRGKQRDKKYSVSKFWFLVDNSFEGGQTHCT